MEYKSGESYHDWLVIDDKRYKNNIRYEEGVVYSSLTVLSNFEDSPISKYSCGTAADAFAGTYVEVEVLSKWFCYFLRVLGLY